MVERTWATKVALGLPLVDEDQEEKVIRRAQKWASYYALSPRVVERIFKEILVEGKRRANPAGTVRSRKQTRTVPASTRSRRTKRDAR